MHVDGVVDAEEVVELLDDMELDRGGAHVVVPPPLVALEAEVAGAAIFPQRLQLC